MDLLTNLSMCILYMLVKKSTWTCQVSVWCKCYGCTCSWMGSTIRLSDQPGDVKCGCYGCWCGYYDRRAGPAGLPVRPRDTHGKALSGWQVLKLQPALCLFLQSLYSHTMRVRGVIYRKVIHGQTRRHKYPRTCGQDQFVAKAPGSSGDYGSVLDILRSGL
eukprot:1007063-Prorocentrum_minimum.AAC.3